MTTPPLFRAPGMARSAVIGAGVDKRNRIGRSLGGVVQGREIPCLARPHCPRIRDRKYGGVGAGPASSELKIEALVFLTAIIAMLLSNIKVRETFGLAAPFGVVDEELRTHHLIADTQRGPRSR